MNMIERVARAMVAADSGPEGSSLFEIHWEEFGDGYIRTSRAAIEVMREPTEVMSEVGRDHNFNRYAEPAWKAMIDAALDTTA